VNICKGRCGRPLIRSRRAPIPPGHGRHAAHGRCTACRAHTDRGAVVADYPRRTWRRDDLLEEWAMLRSSGSTRDEAADRLGMTLTAFDRALQRARAAGDERAVPGQRTRAIATGDGIARVASGSHRRDRMIQQRGAA
jgi:hypothetical protein